MGNKPSVTMSRDVYVILVHACIKSGLIRVKGSGHSLFDDVDDGSFIITPAPIMNEWVQLLPMRLTKPCQSPIPPPTYHGHLPTAKISQYQTSTMLHAGWTFKNYLKRSGWVQQVADHELDADLASSRGRKGYHIESLLLDLSGSIGLLL